MQSSQASIATKDYLPSIHIKVSGRLRDPTSAHFKVEQLIIPHLGLAFGDKEGSEGVRNSEGMLLRVRLAMPHYLILAIYINKKPKSPGVE